MGDLKTVYDSLEEIPETIDDFRALFTEKGGKFELTGLAGVQTAGNVSRLETSLASSRAEFKEAKAKLSVWGDLDHADTVAKLDRIPELEAAAGGKLDEAGIEAIVTKRVEGTLRTKLAPLERELKTAKGELLELTETNTGLAADALRRSREDVLRPLLVKAHVLPEYHEDAILYAERHLERTDDGGFFAREGLTGITSGATPTDWLNEMIEKRPRWLPDSQGGGAKGSGGGGGGFSGSNPWTDAGWNMTKQGQIVTSKGEEYAERLAKAAGTTLGGKRPAAKTA